MSKKLSLESLLSKVQENVQETVITESVIEAFIPVIDFDDILTEWSYRCDSGYPTVGKQSDMLHLQAILEEKGIESPFERLTEAKLGASGKALMAKLADPKLNIRPEALTQIQKVLETSSESDQKILLSKFQTYTLDQFIKGGYKVFEKFFDAKSSQGMGRGEMMCVMGIKDSRSGGTAEKDLVINSGPKKGVWEVKEDPTGIRMAQAGFSGRFGYIQKMTEFYNMLKVRSSRSTFGYF